VWVNWENGAGSWYNTGRDGRYELIERYMLTSWMYARARA